MYVLLSTKVVCTDCLLYHIFLKSKMRVPPHLPPFIMDKKVPLKFKYIVGTEKGRGAESVAVTDHKTRV